MTILKIKKKYSELNFKDKKLAVFKNKKTLLEKIFWSKIQLIENSNKLVCYSLKFHLVIEILHVRNIL